MFKFLTTFPPRRRSSPIGLFLGTVLENQTDFFLADNPETVDDIHRAMFLAYSSQIFSFIFSQKLDYLVLGWLEFFRHFFYLLTHKHLASGAAA